MLPTQDVLKIIERLPQDQQDDVLELRSLIVSTAPGATEKPQRAGLSYYFAERGGPVGASLCQIIWLSGEILLAFNHGAFLPDPKALLHWSGKYKRYVRLPDYARVPWDDLRELIGQAARFDPYTLTFR